MQWEVEGRCWIGGEGRAQLMHMHMQHTIVSGWQNMYMDIMHVRMRMHIHMSIHNDYAHAYAHGHGHVTLTCTMHMLHMHMQLPYARM